MKQFSISKPTPLEHDAVGNAIYNFGITETTQGEEKGFEYEEYHLPYPADEDTAIREVLTSRYPVDKEQKLINEHLSAELGLLSAADSKKATEAYKAFLKDRASIISSVRADFQSK